MNLLVIGGAGFPGNATVQALHDAGHTVRVLPGLESTPDRAAELAQARQGSALFDATIDFSARSAEDVRLVRETWGALAGHYLLVSSCEVYPNVPRDSPWRADELPLVSDEGLASLSPRVRGLRAAERELCLSASGLPWTVVRPAVVEGSADPAPRAAWFVSRVLDGGPLVLPAGSGLVYRHVTAADLARALGVTAGRPETFSRVLHVTGEGLLSTWGHAAMLMDGLGRRVPFAYVPADEWQAAGLTLPYGDVAHAAFLEPSQLLFDLGFEPSDELASVNEMARAIAQSAPQPNPHARAAERRLADETQARASSSSSKRARAASPGRQWKLTGEPGAPATVRLEWSDEIPPLPAPVLRTRQVALSVAERLLLAGELPADPGRRVLGHDALVEVVEPGTSGLVAGSLHLPLARLPCDVPTCAWCREPAALTLGVDTDGYGARFTTTPAEHLVPVSPAAEPYALLADPLALLTEALAKVIEKNAVVWICGRSVEAVICGWLARDAGASVRSVERLAHAGENGIDPTIAIDEAVAAVQQARIPPPGVAIELTGSADLGRQLASALAPRGVLVGWRKPAFIDPRVRFVALPPAAPSRQSLAQALEKLVRWAPVRDLSRLTGPAVAPDLFWDAFAPAPFSLPYLEERP